MPSPTTPSSPASSIPNNTAAEGSDPLSLGGLIGQLSTLHGLAVSMLCDMSVAGLDQEAKREFDDVLYLVNAASTVTNALAEQAKVREP